MLEVQYSTSLHNRIFNNRNLPVSSRRIKLWCLQHLPCTCGLVFTIYRLSLIINQCAVPVILNQFLLKFYRLTIYLCCHFLWLHVLVSSGDGVFAWRWFDVPVKPIRGSVWWVDGSVLLVRAGRSHSRCSPAGLCPQVRHELLNLTSHWTMITVVPIKLSALLVSVTFNSVINKCDMHTVELGCTVYLCMLLNCWW